MMEMAAWLVFAKSFPCVDPSPGGILKFPDFRPVVSLCSCTPGANGAGKSSLLRVVAGKHFHHPDKVRVFGRPAFHDTSLSLEVAHLGDRWGYESHGDVSVSELIASIEGSDRERCDMLMEVLEIEEHWKICRISDGQRRRVQLLLGLARPSKLLLLDEVTTDLDVVGRQNLLQVKSDDAPHAKPYEL